MSIRGDSSRRPRWPDRCVFATDFRVAKRVQGGTEDHRQCVRAVPYQDDPHARRGRQGAAGSRVRRSRARNARHHYPHTQVGSRSEVAMDTPAAWIAVHHRELLLVSSDRRPRVLSDRTPVDRGGCAIPAPARSTDDALARREVGATSSTLPGMEARSPTKIPVIPASKGKRIGCSEAGTYFLLTPDWVEAD